jgi:hypothetical protein
MGARIGERIEGALDHRQQGEVAGQAAKLDFVRDVVQVALGAPEHARQVVGVALQPLDLPVDARMADLGQRKLAADADDHVPIGDGGRKGLDLRRERLEFLGRGRDRLGLRRLGRSGGRIDDLLDRQRRLARDGLGSAAGDRDAGGGKEQWSQEPDSLVSHRNVSFQLRSSANTATAVGSILPARRSADDLTFSCRLRRNGLTRFSSPIVDGSVGRPSARRAAARLT